MAFDDARVRSAKRKLATEIRAALGLKKSDAEDLTKAIEDLINRKLEAYWDETHG